jgi:hypothetical protein
VENSGEWSPIIRAFVIILYHISPFVKPLPNIFIHTYPDLSSFYPYKNMEKYPHIVMLFK